MSTSHPRTGPSGGPDPQSSPVPGRQQGGAEGPETTTEQVRARVRTCIADSGLAQREFARRMELEETKLSKALGGTRRFSPAELVRIATIGGVTVNWLVSGSDSARGPAAVPAAASLPRKVRETPEQVRRRQEIVESGWKLFASHGLHGVRISEIAEDCGVSTAAVYYYFASKRELFEETLRYSVKLAFDRQVASLHLISGPRERLEHLIGLQLPRGSAGSLEFSIWLQAWSEIAVGAGSQQNHADAYQRWYRTVLDAVREGQEAGVFVDEPADDLATQVTSLIDGLGIKVLIGALDVEQMWTQIDRFLARAVLVPDASPGTGRSFAALSDLGTDTTPANPTDPGTDTTPANPTDPAHRTTPENPHEKDQS